MLQRRRKARVWPRLLMDIGIAGAVLTVFALFHHVLPRQQQSIGIAISNPYAADETADGVPRETASPAAKTAAETPAPQRPAGQPSAGAAVSESGRKTATPAPAGGSKQKKRSAFGTEWGASTGKGGSALTKASSAAPDAASGTPLAQKFADQYTDEVTVTANSYSSPDISITVTENHASNSRITYYLADIYVRDITCFRTALAQDTYGSGYRDSITDMAVLNQALLAVNGDYYGNTNEGVVIRNGMVYRANPTDCDICVLYYDGTLQVIPGSTFSVEDAIARGAWQAWTFGPALLDANGNAISSFSSTKHLISANPRTALGYYEPGHYCLVVVDGRGESAGITLQGLSQLFESLGCTAAYNLDGGNSSVMVWQDAVINDPSGGGRESSDALLIAEVRDHE